MNRKQKRDAKNARHKRNERRREFIRLLKNCPRLFELMSDIEASRKMWQ